LVAACTSESDGEVDVAGAYGHVVDWVAERSAQDSDRPVVFMIALGEGFEIDLSLQAAILNDASDDVDVQFVDDRSEAFDGDGLVRDNGVLLAVGPASVDRRDVVIEADEVLREEVAISWRFELRVDADDEWSFVGSPSIVKG
jgi:hypothetical protein